jgi:hypothetical protein
MLWVVWLALIGPLNLHHVTYMRADSLIKYPLPEFIIINPEVPITPLLIMSFPAASPVIAIPVG